MMAAEIGPREICGIALVLFLLAPKQWFWKLCLDLLGWKLQGTLPSCRKCVVACYPHTSGWDLLYGLFLVNGVPEDSKIMMKASLTWMKLLGLPVQAVSRGKNAGQADALAKSFQSVSSRWLWLWISGTRKKSDFISSGFYYIAREGGVAIVFGGIDYRTKSFIASAPHDPQKLSKEEVLKLYQEFARKHDLANSGCIPGNASTIVFRDAAKKAK
ncbi:hypothetical protein TL16_g09294 [Triparma laevis f. inornata]|uniref:Phospholipid/glycerol acyltransferase domain-containing protein n=2 Tax=Triparma laevis TaxID=1534972 RepID=A0A9W7ATU8_9STRA|nr:hypothetical protein TrLO_g14912 [Triparma laevis f. longispina]GMH82546.1 hypothetical protein TL16_g09294 [Triparma laevis f. inornata]